MTEEMRLKMEEMLTKHLNKFDLAPAFSGITYQQGFEDCYDLISVELEKLSCRLKEIDTWDMSSIIALQKDNARLKKLAQDLDGYTLHGGCESHRGLNKCTCGLTELRKGLE
jgi:hypothetical protein